METSTFTGIFNSPETSIDPISDKVRNVIQFMNLGVLCICVSIFGVGTNIMNISVFVKQGFKDSINISLMGLAISDLCCSITVFWTSLPFIPEFNHLDVPVVFFDVIYVTGGWPHICFNRITSFITAFITLERCLCITMPLKVKNIITPFRTKVINVSIFNFTIVLFSPFYFVNKLEWAFLASRNRSVVRLTVTADKEMVDAVTYFIHSVFLSTVLFLTVTICTVILIVNLKKKAKWRKESVKQTAQGQDIASDKDKKVIKMIISIATIFIICYIPPTVCFIVMACYPEFSFTGKFQNIYMVVWSSTFVMDTLNSSVNIFVYYKMSSKFKATLCKIFSR